MVPEFMSLLIQLELQVRTVMLVYNGMLMLTANSFLYVEVSYCRMQYSNSLRYQVKLVMRSRSATLGILQLCIQKCSLTKTIPVATT